MAIPTCSGVEQKPVLLSTGGKPVLESKVGFSPTTFSNSQHRQVRNATLAAAAIEILPQSSSKHVENIHQIIRHSSPSPSILSAASFCSMSDSSIIRIRQPVSVLQRTESNAIENEVLTLRFLTRITIPVPEILRLLHDRTRRKITAAILDRPPGVSYASVCWPKTDPRHRHVHSQITIAKALIARARSRAWGPLASVCAGTGCASWRDAFLAIFDALLLDAEDSWVNLPYSEIRAALIKPWDGPEHAKEAQLVIPGFGQPERVLVDEETGNVTAYVGFRESFWGDAEMLDARTTTPLYKAYQALRAITMQSVRPTEAGGRDVISARTTMFAALAELNGTSV